TIVPASMLADVTDEDAQGTGRRREGIFFGIFGFGQKLMTGLSVLIAGVLVERFAGLAAGQASPSAFTIERVAMLGTLAPAGLLAVGGLLMLRYPLDRRRVAAIQAQLMRGQAAGVGEPGQVYGPNATWR